MEVGIVKNDTWPQMKPISPSMQRLRCNSNQSPQLVRPADAPCSQEALPYMLSILIKPTYPPSQSPLHLPFLCLFGGFVAVINLQ